MYKRQNQYFPPEQIVPKSGVYATVAVVDGRRYAGATNVGIKPTVDGTELLSETNLIGFSGDLYGRQLTVEFYEYIRGETKFSSLQQLREAIAKDALTAAQLSAKYL